MSDAIEAQEDRWERVGGAYFFKDFDAIPNKRSRRPDLHAFLLLDELFPSDRDIACAARHDEIYLRFGGPEVEKLSDEQIIELSRCGVRYSEGSLCMFT